MKLDELKPAKGSRKNSKRLGRGPGTGWGRTSGRGEKGAGSRSGNKDRSWFEGGQMPILRRLPKRGFSNYRFKKEFQIVNLSMLESLSNNTIDGQLLAKEGIIKSAFEPIKILGNGEITKSLEVIANSFSKAATEKIQKAGGKAIIQ